MGVAWGATVGKVGRCTSAEARWDKARALYPGIGAARQTRLRERVNVSLRIDGHDPPAVFIGRDQVASEFAKGTRRNCDAAFEPRGTPRDRAHAAGTIHCEERCAAQEARRDQEAM